jgi:hypothetical protein
MTKANKKTPKSPSMKTPLQIVKDRFGDKATLVADLAGRLERRAEESKGDLQARLAKVSSAKLMTLHAMMESVEKIGGRSSLINAIHDFRVGTNSKEDSSLKVHLGKKTLGALYDEYKVIQKRLRAASK